MKNELLNKIDIDNDLQDLIKATENLNNKIQLMGQSIQHIICKLTSCNKDKANEYFDHLMKIQTTLSKIHNLYDIKLPVKLINFVNDFDRIDDEETREYILKKIQNSSYQFGQKLD